MLSENMTGSFGIRPYSEEYLNRIATAETTKEVLPAKLQKIELLGSQRFLIAYQYLEEFVERGGIPIAESGHLYEHDISVHLFAVFAFPEFWRALRDSVKVARDSILYLDFRNKSNFEVAVKITENIVDLVDTATFRTVQSLYGPLTKAFEESSYDPQKFSLDIQKKVQDASLLFKIEDAIEIGTDIQKSYFENYRIAKSNKCDQFPCPPIDLLHGIVKSESIYNEINFSPAELKAVEHLIKKLEQKEKFTNPVAAFKKLGFSSKAYGKKQINFIQKVDLALERWKKKNNVDFISPN